MPARQPFAAEPSAFVVLPERDPTVGGSVQLLELERDEFEAELGAPVEIVAADPGDGARLILEIADDAATPAASYDPARKTIVCRAADAAGVIEALSLVRTLTRSGQRTVEASECVDVAEAIERVVAEVADTYPPFGLRQLDWAAICTRHVERVRRAAEPLPAFQRWLAELADAHTWVREPQGNLPYSLRLDAGATFTAFPPVRLGARSASKRRGRSPRSKEKRSTSPIG